MSCLVAENVPLNMWSMVRCCTPCIRNAVPVYDFAANIPMTTAIETSDTSAITKAFNDAGRFFRHRYA